MSLILNNISTPTWNMLDGPGDDYRDAQMLDRYLAIMETNKAASRFVPNDVMLALDMVGFVRDHLAGANSAAKVSTARMALALVQPLQTPLQ